MKLHGPAFLTLCFVVGACSDPTPKPATASTPSAAAPLTSWSQGAARSAIVDFVERTTRQGTPDFVPQAERIAVFDNDGTLWAEQPMYFQLAFALDRIRALAPEHPEWKTTQPFKGVLEGDLKAVLDGGERDGLSADARGADEGRIAVGSQVIQRHGVDWLGRTCCRWSPRVTAEIRSKSSRRSARHPVTKRPYVAGQNYRRTPVFTALHQRVYIAGGC